MPAVIACGLLPFRPEPGGPVDPVALGSGCDEHGESREPENPLLHAATRKSCDPAHPPRPENDRLTLPVDGLVHDSPRHLVLEGRSESTFRSHAGCSKREHRVTYQILRVDGCLERHHASHPRKLTDVKHTDAGVVGCGYSCGEV